MGVQLPTLHARELLSGDSRRRLRPLHLCTRPACVLLPGKSPCQVAGLPGPACPWHWEVWGQGHRQGTVPPAVEGKCGGSPGWPVLEGDWWEWRGNLRHPILFFFFF